MKIKMTSIFIAMVLFVGCSSKIPSVDDIQSATHYNSDQLSWFENFTVLQDKPLLLTSMVNVNNFSQTSNFGRLYTDTMMNQLEQEGWKIIDFRGKKIITKKMGGEYFLDREALQGVPKDANILVGTYGYYENGLLINLRILSLKENKVLTTSSVLLKDKESVALAMQDNCKTLHCLKHTGIRMVQDDCSNAHKCSKD